MDARRATEGEAFEGDAHWRPWSPVEVATRLEGARTPWYVVAGWALDLYRGHQSRVHSDIEIGVPAQGFTEIRTILAPYEFDVVGSGRRWPLDSDAFDIHFQTWVRAPASDVYLLDVFRDPHDGPQWLCRRDPRIRMPFEQLIRHTAEGVPYMSPEVVLLFKGKHLREKDQTDFEGVLPLLDTSQIDWLRTNLELLHPRHTWLKELESI